MATGRSRPCDNPAPRAAGGPCCAGRGPYVRGSAGLAAGGRRAGSMPFSTLASGGRRIKRKRRDPRVTDRSSSVSGVAERYAGNAQVVKLDVARNTSVVKKFRIEAIPPLIVFRGGKEKERIIGAVSQDAIARAIDAHLSAMN